MTEDPKSQMKHPHTTSAQVKLNKISIGTVIAISKGHSNLRQFSTLLSLYQSLSVSVSVYSLHFPSFIFSM